MNTDSNRTPKHILFLAASELPARNIFESNIPILLAQHPGVRVTFVSGNPQDNEKIKQLNQPNLQWAKMVCFVDDLVDQYKDHEKDLLRKIKIVSTVVRRSLFRGFLVRLKEALEIKLLYKLLLWRFRALKNLEKGAGKNFSHPLLWRRKSRFLFNLFYGINYWRGWRDPEVNAFFKKNKFDLVVISHLQNHYITPYVLIAQKYKIPILGIIASWDQPTSKGPLPPGIQHYIAQSQYVADALAQHHGIDPSKINITGWTQLDAYKHQKFFRSKEDFLEHFGFEAGSKVIFYGANTISWGAHEPDVVRHLIDRLSMYGEKVCLVVRTHPRDREWKRFTVFETPGKVVVQIAKADDLDRLANLLKYADVVISSGGSLILDGVSFDNHVINLRFSSEKQYAISDAFEKFHLIELLKAGGTKLVDSYQELDLAVADYLKNPDVDKGERNRLKKRFIEPFDGKASFRTVDEILKML